jgi:hypothetical protein
MPPTVTWYVREMDRKARAGTTEDVFVRIIYQYEPEVEYRHKGADRMARLGASKIQ